MNRSPRAPTAPAPTLRLRFSGTTRIAQFPHDRRGDSRLMVVNRSTGAISHKQFSDLERLDSAQRTESSPTRLASFARAAGIRENGIPPKGPAPSAAHRFNMGSDGARRRQLRKPGRTGSIIADDFEAEVIVCPTTERLSSGAGSTRHCPIEQAIESAATSLCLRTSRAPTSRRTPGRYQTVLCRLSTGSVAAPDRRSAFHTGRCWTELSAKG